MDRPEALNAISTAQAHAITAACAELTADPSLSVVIIRSAVERAFCVGADLLERAGFSDDDLRAQRLITQAAYGSVLNLAMPTIAAVEGFALGGGCELALSCDVIIASTTAVLGLPEVGLGLVPGGGGTQLLPRRVGRHRAAEMIFTGRHVGAAEALSRGLVDQLVDRGQAGAAARELAAVIASKSPVALRNAKAALRHGADVDLATAMVIENDAWERTAFSADRVEGIAAFNDRRAPRWPDPR